MHHFFKKNPKFFAQNGPFLFGSLALHLGLLGFLLYCSFQKEVHLFGDQKSQGPFWIEQFFVAKSNPKMSQPSKFSEVQIDPDWPLTRTVSKNLKPVQENQVSLGGGQAGNSPVQSENDEIFRKIREKIEQAKIYPQLALRRGLSGVVRIRFQVGEDGLPKKTQILESSGSELLDNATLKTLDRAAPFPRVAGWISFPLRYDLARNPS